MKITLRRSGGYAGLSGQRVINDTGALSATQQTEVAAAVTTLRRLSAGQSAPGADMERYEIVIDDAGRQNTLSFVDDGSANAQQLLQAVESLQNAAP